MKITNLFLDYILVAMVWFLAFCLVVYSWQRELGIHNFISNLEPILVPFYTAVIYVIGVFLDQLSNRLLDWFRNPLLLKEIDNAKKSFKKENGQTYHESLQQVVNSSDRAYEYLSYRRSAIRIVRAMFTSYTIALILLILAGIYFLWFEGIESLISIHSGASILLLFAVIFLRKETIKLHLGYFSAIKNFSKYAPPPSNV